MATMVKATLALIAICAAVVTAESEKKPNFSVIGSRASGDHLLQREFVKEDKKSWQVVQITRTFVGDQRSKITQVRLLDQNAKGDGATASVIQGGPGEPFVTVNFKSKRGHSVDYIVEIYGR